MLLGSAAAALIFDQKLGREWLQAELEKRGVMSPQEVLFATLDTQGDLFVVRNQDVPFLQAVFRGVQTQVPPGLPPRVH